MCIYKKSISDTFEKLMILKMASNWQPRVWQKRSGKGQDATGYWCLTLFWTLFWNITIVSTIRTSSKRNSSKLLGIKLDCFGPTWLDCLTPGLFDLFEIPHLLAKYFGLYFGCCLDKLEVLTVRSYKTVETHSNFAKNCGR